MCTTFHGIGKLFCLIILVLGFAGCGGGSGSSNNGGFTNPDNLISVRIRADSTTLPANMNNEQPSLLLPYTTSVIVTVTRKDNTIYADENATVQLAVDGVRHGAISTLDNPETPDVNEFFILLGQGFTDIGSGQAQFFFTSFSEPGIATLTASVVDPVSGRPIAKRLQIEVVGTERPVSSLTFTGPFVNAVLTNQAFFNDPNALLADGSYSRVVSVVANDASGNPVNQGTPINFFLIDTPITGYPNEGPGSFFVAGDNGNPLEGGFRFDASGGQFFNKGARAFDRLVLDGRQLLPKADNPVPDNAHQTGIRVVQNIVSNSQLFIDQRGVPFNRRVDSFDTGPTVPYAIGRARHGTIRSPAFTNVNGVASTLLTYPVFRLGQTAILVACTVDFGVCTVLNTCDASGANCGSVYLGVSNGFDRILTVSETELRANTTSNVELCLEDVNFTPLPSTAIDYDIGPQGAATVTIDGDPSDRGKVLTKGDGCVTITITSSGQIEGSDPIEIAFSAQDISGPVTVTIKGPGSGNLIGTVDDTGENPVVNLQLLNDNGVPIPDTFISHEVTTTDEDNTCFEDTGTGFNRDNVIPSASVTYPDGQFTDTEGRLTAEIELFGDNGDVVTITFTSFGGAKFTITFTIIEEGFETCPPSGGDNGGGGGTLLPGA